MEMMIFFLCLFICAESQNTSNQTNQNGINPLHPSIGVVLTVFSILLFITFVIVGYSKFCQRLEPRTSEGESDANGILRSRSRFSGLDRTTVESLPFFRFSSLKGSKEGLECSVCLSRFEGDEVLRLLPKCRHAFHVDCIDTWLVAHSSCPLCRYRLNVGDIKSAELLNLEFFVQREENQGKSSRFYVANLDFFIKNKSEDRKTVHKFKHRIIVSDVIHKSRWSDVSSSDMISLNSEMLNSTLIATGVPAKDPILKIKEDMERKRVFEAKIVANNGNCSGEISGCCNDSDMKALDPAQKRSMSEITNISRFPELNTSSRRVDGSSTEKDDKVRRLWLSIARRTIQWFSVQETSPEARKNALHV